MIVRIMAEGQYELPDDVAAKLNELDNEAVAAVEAGDEARFQQLFDQMIELVEARLVAGLHGRDGLVVELVELVPGAFRDPVLVLRRDADDHAVPSWDFCSRAGASEVPGPSSAFILASSSSTAVPVESCASSRSRSS